MRLATCFDPRKHHRRRPTVFAPVKNTNGLEKKFKYSTKCADNRDNLIRILCRDDGNSPVSGYLFPDGH